MTRKAPEPSRPAATTATAMLGPVVASAGFVGVVRGAVTTGVADGLAGVPVSVVTVVAGADGVGVAAGVVVSEVGGAVGAGAVVSVAGVDGVVSGVGVGLGTVVPVGGVSVVFGGVLLFVVVVVVLVVVVVDGVSVELLTL